MSVRKNITALALSAALAMQVMAMVAFSEDLGDTAPGYSAGFPGYMVYNQEQLADWMELHTQTGETVYLGKTITVTGSSLFDFADYITIDTGRYGLVLEDTFCNLENIDVTGQGVETPVVTAGNHAQLHLYSGSITATGKDGVGGVALQVLEGAYLSSGGASVATISAHGTGAVGIQADGDLFFDEELFRDVDQGLLEEGMYAGGGLDGGWGSGSLAFVPTYGCTIVRATGRGSRGIVAGGDVGLFLFHVQGEAAAVEAGGSVQLDTCKVAPAVQGASTIRRKVVRADGDLQFWATQGDSYLMEGGVNDIFAAYYADTFYLWAEGAEERAIATEYGLRRAPVDFDTVGSYEIPIQLAEPYASLVLDNDPPLAITYHVTDPDQTYITSIVLHHDYQEDRRYLFFHLFGSGFLRDDYKLMRSEDEGETWKEAPLKYDNDEDTEWWYLLTPFGGTFPSDYKIVAPLEGWESNTCRVWFTEEDGFRTLLDVGGGRGGGDREGQEELEPGNGPTPIRQQPIQRPSGGSNGNGSGSGSSVRDRNPPRLNSEPITSTAPLRAEAVTVPTPWSEAQASPVIQDAGPTSGTQAEEEEDGAAQKPASQPAKPREYTDDVTIGITGERLAAMIAAAGEEVAFARQGIQVWIPSSVLLELGLGEDDLFELRIEKLSENSVLVQLRINGEICTEAFAEPFTVGIPWTDEAGLVPVCSDEAGGLVRSELDAAAGLLLLMPDRMGTYAWEAAVDAKMTAAPQDLLGEEPPGDGRGENRTVGTAAAVLAAMVLAAGIGALAYRRVRGKGGSGR